MPDSRKEYAMRQAWSPASHGGVMQISGLKWVDGEVPYMDTMCAGKIAYDGTLTVGTGFGGDLDLCSQEGYIEGSMTCDYCGECCGTGDMVVSADGEDICSLCRDAHYFDCSYCGNWEHNDGRYETVDEDSICSTCARRHYVKCDECRDYVITDELYDTDTGGGVCTHCKNDMTACSRCGRYTDDAEVCDADESPICQMCASVLLSSV